jgi:hypothetical protein
MVFYTIRQSLLYLFSPHSVPDFALYFLFTVNLANLQQRISSLASVFLHLREDIARSSFRQALKKKNIFEFPDPDPKRACILFRNSGI